MKNHKDSARPARSRGAGRLGSQDRDTARDELRAWKAADPFVPFTICMKDGRMFEVPSPEYLLVPPVSEWVLVGDGEGSAHRVYMPWIKTIQRRSGGGQTRRRRAG